MKLKYDLESDIDKESIKEIVYMAALKEIIRQVSVHSCLRGCLLKNTVEVLSLIWKNYTPNLTEKLAEEKQKSKKKIADLIYKNAEEKADLQVELSRSNRKNQELSKRIKFLDDEIAQLKRFILKFQNELVRKQELILAAKRKMLRQDSIQEKFFVDRMMTENLKRTSNRLCQTDFQDEKKQDSVQRIIVDDAKESETVIKETDFEEQSIHQYNSDETSNGKVCNHTELPDSSCVSLSSESSINNTDFQSFDLENDQVNILEIENFSKILIQDQFLKFEAQNCDNLQIQDTDIWDKPIEHINLVHGESEIPKSLIISLI